jgi:hypothetical protein
MNGNACGAFFDAVFKQARLAWDFRRADSQLQCLPKRSDGIGSSRYANPEYSIFLT